MYLQNMYQICDNSPVLIFHLIFLQTHRFVGCNCVDWSSIFIAELEHIICMLNSIVFVHHEEFAVGEGLWLDTLQTILVMQLLLN